MFMGIDCGTQGTKAVVFDPDKGEIVGAGHATHEIIADDRGRREQHPSWWIAAAKTAVRAAVERSGVAPDAIKAVGCSGQQHGLVMLDGEGKVLREAKLWNDMETADANREITAEAGGEVALARRLGTSVPVGYTASKIRWMMKREPAIYKRVKHVMTPHDYLNYWLTGRCVMEPGDASGTGFYQVVEKKWDLGMVNLIDPSGVLAAALPPLIESQDCVGNLRPEAAKELGLTTATLVSGGSGDNEMGAFGTGNVKKGLSTLGLGTSGVLNIFSDQPLHDCHPVMQVFAAAAGGWLATTCTVNATSATASIQKLLGLDLDAFTSAVASVPPGADGLTVFPFFNGERMPPLPESRGIILGATNNNLTRAHLARATAEAVIYTLKWGFDRQIETMPRPTLLRLTGGGANNPAWRQIVADILDTESIGLLHDEGGAFGAALLSMLMLSRMNGGGETAASICDRYVKLDPEKRAVPVPANAAAYKELYAKYDELRKKHYGV